MGDGSLVIAGLLGGSGSHVVQIIVGIVVAVALISYFLFRLAGGSRVGDASAVATTVTRQAGGAASSDATLRLVRAWGIGAHGQQWNIVIDGIVVGSIADKETVEVAVEPGHRTFRLEFEQTPQHRAFVRRCAGRGRQLPLQPSEGLATAGGGTHQAGPVDLAQARLRSVAQLPARGVEPRLPP